MTQQIDARFVVSVWLFHFSIPAVSILPISSGYRDYLKYKAFLLFV